MSFIIESARCSDWPWIIDGHVEAALESLPPIRQASVDKAVLKKHVSEEISRLTEAGGEASVVLVARKPEGEPIGFVWVGDKKSQFTDEIKAFVYGVFVTQKHRRGGIGNKLMKAAENWALSRGHQTIVLNVAAHNIPALVMYEALGFSVVAKTMSKELGGQRLATYGDLAEG